MEILGIVASQAKAFVPTDIAGLKLWLDAADTSTISVSGSAVTQWNDKSGNSYNFNQSTSGNRPLSGTRTINSKNVIDFDGTDDRLVSMSAKSVWSFMHSANSTFFWAGVSDTTVGDNYLMADTIGTGTQRGWASTVSALAKVGVSAYTGNAAGAAGAVLEAETTTSYTTSPFYASIKTSPGAATADRGKLAINAGSFEGTNTRTATAVTSDSPNDMYIGSVIFSGVFYGPFNGGMGEIIIYDSILSAGDITKVQAYLASKWGI